MDFPFTSDACRSQYGHLTFAVMRYFLSGRAESLTVLNWCELPAFALNDFPSFTFRHVEVYLEISRKKLFRGLCCRYPGMVCASGAFANEKSMLAQPLKEVANHIRIFLRRVNFLKH